MSWLPPSGQSAASPLPSWGAADPGLPVLGDRHVIELRAGAQMLDADVVALQARGFIRDVLASGDFRHSLWVTVLFAAITVPTC